MGRRDTRTGYGFTEQNIKIMEEKWTTFLEGSGRDLTELIPSFMWKNCRKPQEISE
jgi:hypothetical protein